jgi:23S rRNA (adenine2503-C2)-methyltransferase
MMEERTDVKSLFFQELDQQLREKGLKAFRSGQIFQWIHEKQADSFADMTNLPKDLRQRLMEEYDLVTLKQEDVRISKIDGTRKYLFGLKDGHVIESVWMKYRHGNSVCISSQVGCRMGCRFCASTLDGLERNLKPSEMLDQIYRIQKDTGERVSHVVVMGSGEPLDNYDNLVRFIRLVSDERGLMISQRNITVSTCGIVPGIQRLSEEGLSVTLALSLHAPNDQVRRKLMPVAGRYALKDILSACRGYFERTGRRLTFEYSLVKGVNDNLEEAKALADLIKDQQGHVNLIPVNPIKERSYVQSDNGAVERFRRCLEKSGINVTVRREMGRDINGACGQLRRSFRKRTSVTKGRIDEDESIWDD